MISIYQKKLSCVLCYANRHPDVWSGDAGVETAEEAVEPADPDINELCTDMFGKMAIFLQGELTGILTLIVIVFTLFACILYSLFKSTVHIFRHLWGLSSAGEHEQTN